MKLEVEVYGNNQKQEVITNLVEDTRSITTVTIKVGDLRVYKTHKELMRKYPLLDKLVFGRSVQELEKLEQKEELDEDDQELLERLRGRLSDEMPVEFSNGDVEWLLYGIIKENGVKNFKKKFQKTITELNNEIKNLKEEVGEIYETLEYELNI